MVNLAGCFAIAAVMHIALTFGWPTAIRTAITVGFLGGFTTYSSFNYETMRLAESGAMGAAAANAALTIVGGFAAGWIGLLCARGLVGRGTGFEFREPGSFLLVRGALLEPLLQRLGGLEVRERDRVGVRCPLIDAHRHRVVALLRDDGRGLGFGLDLGAVGAIGVARLPLRQLRLV